MHLRTSARVHAHARRFYISKKKMFLSFRHFDLLFINTLYNIRNNRWPLSAIYFQYAPTLYYNDISSPSKRVGGYTSFLAKLYKIFLRFVYFIIRYFSIVSSIMVYSYNILYIFSIPIEYVNCRVQGCRIIE